MAFWQDRNEKKNGALLYGPWVSYFLSHQIVNFSTFRIYCKLTFQEIPKSWKSKFPFPTKLETIGATRVYKIPMDKPALGTGPSKFLGQARSWDRPFKILGTSPLLGQALQNSWDKPALGTCPSKLLGQARSWDRPALGTCQRFCI